MKCSYCGKEAVFHKTSDHRYRKDFGPIWECEPCKAWVGCHKGGDNPLGILANAELRKLKMEAHAAFDPFWKKHKRRRKGAYAMLARTMGIKEEDCHIGYFDVSQCVQVIELCKRS